MNYNFSIKKYLNNPLSSIVQEQCVDLVSTAQTAADDRIKFSLYQFIIEYYL